MPDGQITLWWRPSPDRRGHLVARGPKGVVYSVPAVFMGWRARVKWDQTWEQPRGEPLPPEVVPALARVLGLPGARVPTDADWNIYAVWRIDERRELDRLDEECRRDPLRFMGSPDYHRLREEAMA